VAMRIRSLIRVRKLDQSGRKCHVSAMC